MKVSLTLPHLFAFLLLSQFCLFASPEPPVIHPVADLEVRAKESLKTQHKYEIKQDLQNFLDSDRPEQEKHRAAVRLAEIWIYSPDVLSNAEELLDYVLNHASDACLKAEVQYLLGLVDYIRSQDQNRSVEVERQSLITQGIGGAEDPFLVLARQHFEQVSSAIRCEAGQKARKAYTALANPGSAEAFEFSLEMAEMFDDSARYDTWNAFKHYARMTSAFESGEVGPSLYDESRLVEDRVWIITKMSKAYFKMGKGEDALAINQEGISLFGPSELTSHLKFNRAYIYKYGDKHEEAQKEYEDLLREYPLDDNTKDTTRFRLVSVLLQQKEKRERAKAVLEELKLTTPMDVNRQKAEKYLQDLSRPNGQ